MSKTWAVFEDSQSNGEVIVIPPASSHPEMQVGIQVGGQRIWLRRETARELAAEIKKQAGAVR